MVAGISSAATSTPWSSEARAVTCPIGSPPMVRSTCVSRSAPIARKISSAPVRVGFRPTSAIVSWDPAIVVAATMKNSALEISPGISHSTPLGVCPPAIVVAVPVVAMSIPAAVNILSVWSRLCSGSVTVVCPLAFRAARRRQVFTCADAIGVS